VKQEHQHENHLRSL